MRNEIQEKEEAMKNQKPLLILVVILAAGLIFETAYIIGLRKGKVETGQWKMPMEHSIDYPFHKPQAVKKKGALDYQSYPNAQWDPFEEMENMHKEMNRMFRDSFGRGMGHSGFGLLEGPGLFDPSLDIKDTPSKYIITFDVPGLEKDNLNIEVKGRTLVVSGERNQETEEKNPGKFYRKERSFGYFSRAVPLPEDADTNVTVEEFKNGVLKLAVPKIKQDEKTASKKVEIK